MPAPYSGSTYAADAISKVISNIFTGMLEGSKREDEIHAAEAALGQTRRREQMEQAFFPQRYQKGQLDITGEEQRQERERLLAPFQRRTAEAGATTAELEAKYGEAALSHRIKEAELGGATAAARLPYVQKLAQLEPEVREAEKARVLASTELLQEQLRREQDPITRQTLEAQLQKLQSELRMFTYAEAHQKRIQESTEEAARLGITGPEDPRFWQYLMKYPDVYSPLQGYGAWMRQAGIDLSERRLIAQTDREARAASRMEAERTVDKIFGKITAPMGAHPERAPAASYFEKVGLNNAYRAQGRPELIKPPGRMPAEVRQQIALIYRGFDARLWVPSEEKRRVHEKFVDLVEQALNAGVSIDEAVAYATGQVQPPKPGAAAPEPPTPAPAPAPVAPRYNAPPAPGEIRPGTPDVPGPTLSDPARFRYDPATGQLVPVPTSP